MRPTALGSDEHTQILLIEDEETVSRFLERKLRSLGFGVFAAPSWDAAKKLLNRSGILPQIIFVEPCSSRETNISVEEICAQAQQVPVVVISISRDPQLIARAIRGGARHYLFKPVEIHQLSQVISDILKRPEELARTALRTAPRQVELVFCSSAMKRIYHTIHQIADTSVPVLIEGESGVGKDLIARLVHQKSILRDQPFVKVNCAAMPAELVESELFGYRKGAFTGAYGDRLGKFEFANGGTIFLDEIGEFPPSAQAKLLQVLQDGIFTRLGSNRETDVNVRVIVATNRRLEEAIKNGAFREDLFYRLNVVNIEVPPLRERREEISLLCEHFLNKFKPQLDGAALRLPEKLQKLFLSYHWPGNTRELENIIKRYIVLRDADSLQVELESKMARLNELTDETDSYLQGYGADLDLKEISKKAAAIAERKMIAQALRRTNWNKWKTAKELRVSYKTLLTKIEQYKIEPFP